MTAEEEKEHAAEVWRYAAQLWATHVPKDERVMQMNKVLVEQLCLFRRSNEN